MYTYLSLRQIHFLVASILTITLQFVCFFSSLVSLVCFPLARLASTHVRNPFLPSDSSPLWPVWLHRLCLCQHRPRLSTLAPQSRWSSQVTGVPVASRLLLLIGTAALYAQEVYWNNNFASMAQPAFIQVAPTQEVVFCTFYHSLWKEPLSTLHFNDVNFQL